MWKKYDDEFKRPALQSGYIRVWVIKAQSNLRWNYKLEMEESKDCLLSKLT